MNIEQYNPNDYEYLREIIVLDKWITYDKYLEIWNGKNGIWNFIHDKQRKKQVYINNFVYNYMDAKEFYFSWKKKGTMVNGELVEKCKFDYLDINHEIIRRKRYVEIEKEKEKVNLHKNTVSGPSVVDIKSINVKIDQISIATPVPT